MYLRRIKIGNSFLILLVLFFLGYTHFLGGPYWLAKFLFIVILIGTLFLLLFVWGMVGFTKRIFKKRISDFDEKSHGVRGENDTIKVDAKIIE